MIGSAVDSRVGACPYRRTGSTSPEHALAVALTILQLQLLQQVPEVGGQTARFGNQILPQPVSDRLANRRAGGTVDLLVSVGILVGHCSSRFGFISMQSHRVTTRSSPAASNCFRFCCSHAFSVTF